MAVSQPVTGWHLRMQGFPIHNPQPPPREFLMAKKIRVEADRCAPKPVLAPGMTLTNHRGQKGSQERGTWSRSKKNPGKRPHKGG
jgi:hypothetical protein